MPKGPQTAFQQYGKFLNALGRSELPLAIRGTMNELAFSSRKRLSEVEMPKKFTLRNKFENKQSLHAHKCPNTFDIDKMVSSMGQLRVVKFQKGPKRTSDLFKQEHGGTVRARPGSEMLRTPTKAARTSKSFSKPVARRNRPTGSTDWKDLREIERELGILRPRSAGRGTRAMSLRDRIRRAHMLMIREQDKLGKGPYMLPLLNNPKALGVFRVVRNKPVLIHTLEKKTRKLKKKETVKPAYEHVVKQTGDIFAKQAQHRIDRAARRTLGLR